MDDRKDKLLGLWMATALVIGNMIGSGLFLLPSVLAPYGGAALLGWGVSLGGMLLLALVFARLGLERPSRGGPYAYARMAFGDKVGFGVAWSYWISNVVGNAAIAVAFVAAIACGQPLARRRHRGLFTFAILLSTATALLPYLVCSAAALRLRDDRRTQLRAAMQSLIALLPLAFSVWALIGTGGQSLFWGAVLLLAGAPLYFWRRWRKAAPLPVTG